MRHRLLTVAGSSYEALRWTPPFPCQPCTPGRTLWTVPGPSLRPQSFPARGGVKVPQRKCRRQQPKSGRVRMSSVDTSPSAQMPEGFVFGPYRISVGEVFLTTKLSFCFVNIRPVVPGHILHEWMGWSFAFKDVDWVSQSVLVCPKRLVPRFADLSAEEVIDLWLTAQRVGEKMESFWEGSSLTLAIQDGPDAGQSVPHVHVHVLPRKGGDFKNNDDIYEEIDKKEKELGEQLNLDQERKDRTKEVMHAEAAQLRALF